MGIRATFIDQDIKVDDPAGLLLWLFTYHKTKKYDGFYHLINLDEVTQPEVDLEEQLDFAKWDDAKLLGYWVSFIVDPDNSKRSGYDEPLYYLQGIAPFISGHVEFEHECEDNLHYRFEFRDDKCFFVMEKMQERVWEEPKEVKLGEDAE